MRGFNKDIKPRIESKYNSFTAIERTIADFFLRNSECRDFSSKAVSSRLYVSEASLSRFAKKCGFQGYREFIFAYKDSMQENPSPEEGISKTVLDTYSELLRKTYSLMDEFQMARVVKLLRSASRVVACGKGSSGLAAEEMESRFMRIGIDIDSLTDADRMHMQSVFLDDTSLVFGFSLSATTEGVLYLLKEAHVRGAKTVFLTANDDPNLRLFCDEVITVASTKNMEYGNILSPQFPLLILLDVIYNSLVNSDRAIKAALHDDTVRALKKTELE